MCRVGSESLLPGCRPVQVLGFTLYIIWAVHCGLYNVYRCWAVHCTLHGLYNVYRGRAVHGTVLTLYRLHELGCRFYSTVSFSTALFFTVCLALHCSILCTVHCTMYAVHCTVYIVHCTVYTVQCTLYLRVDSVQPTLE